MKKTIAVLLALLTLLLAGCSRQSTQETIAETAPSTEAVTEPSTEATTEPVPTEPEWEAGSVRAGYGEAVYCTLEKGQEVTITGEFGNYYVIAGEELDLLVDKTFLRLEEDEVFEPRTGYIKWNTLVYPDAYMESTDTVKPSINTKVTVTEGKDNWLHIQWDGGSGYVTADRISNYPSGGGSSGGDGGGAGGGGNADGSDVPMGSLAYRQEAPHISLLGVYHGPKFTDLEDTTAKALVPDTRAYITLLLRNDTVKVVEADENSCRIYLDGWYADVPRFLTRLDEDDTYEAWSGYARYGAVLYEEYKMRTELRKVSTNTAIQVLDELPGCYVVEIDGQLGYMALDKVSLYRSSSGGSSDGGGGGGGGGSTGGDWTPPAM